MGLAAARRCLSLRLGVWPRRTDSGRRAWHRAATSWTPALRRLAPQHCCRRAARRRCRRSGPSRLPPRRRGVPRRQLRGGGSPPPSDDLGVLATQRRSCVRVAGGSVSAAPRSCSQRASAVLARAAWARRRAGVCGAERGRSAARGAARRATRPADAAQPGGDPRRAAEEHLREPERRRPSLRELGAPAAAGGAPPWRLSARLRSLGARRAPPHARATTWPRCAGRSRTHPASQAPRTAGTRPSFSRLVLAARLSARLHTLGQIYRPMPTTPPPSPPVCRCALGGGRRRGEARLAAASPWRAATARGLTGRAGARAAVASRRGSAPRAASLYGTPARGRRLAAHVWEAHALGGGGRPPAAARARGAARRGGRRAALSPHAPRGWRRPVRWGPPRRAAPGGGRALATRAAAGRVGRHAARVGRVVRRRGRRRRCGSRSGVPSARASGRCSRCEACRVLRLADVGAGTAAPRRCCARPAAGSAPPRYAARGGSSSPRRVAAALRMRARAAAFRDVPQRRYAASPTTPPRHCAEPTLLQPHKLSRDPNPNPTPTPTPTSGSGRAPGDRPAPELP